MEPAVEFEGVRVFHGDCRDVLATLPDNSVDSVVTDPPYGLEFMGKDWDAPWKGKPSREFNQIKEGTLGGFSSLPNHSRVNNVKCGLCDKWRFSSNPCRCDNPKFPNARGQAMFEFQLWATEWAVECLRVLKPGGHVLAFGGSRTWHRLAVAIEDAGFELRDSIAWIYGSGFPKSLDVSKAIDKMDAKDERLARSFIFTNWCRQHLTARQIDDITGTKMGNHLTTHPTQPFVPTEDMFALLRPYLPEVPEDIERLVFDRTVESKNFAEREVIGQQRQGRLAVAPGQGEDRSAINLDITLAKTPEAQKWQGWGTALKPAFEPVVVARKPLEGTVAENVLRWGVGGLNIDGSRIGSENRKNQPAGSLGNAQDEREPTSVQGRWPANVILDEVSAGLLDEQSGVSKPKPARSGRKGGNGGALGQFAGSSPDAIGVWPEDVGGGASRFFYVAKASKRDRNEGLEGLEAEVSGVGALRDGGRESNPRKNFHPTVKPTALMRHLVKLVTPPGGTVLDPFTGSGSTGKAAILEGFEFVGVELTEDYLPIIEGRLKWALENREDGTLF